MTGTPNLLLEGKKASQYTSVTTTSVKEHFEAPNYKLTTFDDAYNALMVKNKNGVNVEFRAYNSGVAYRFVTTSTKGEWTVKDEFRGIFNTYFYWQLSLHCCPFELFLAFYPDTHKYNLPLQKFFPEYDKYPPKQAPLIRNKKIVETCDCLIAFWDG